jgi:hypothetical protein
MARSEARLFVTIWDDEDWRALSGTAQWLYGVVLLTQPDLSWCGVLPYSPRRWAGLAKGVTPKAVTKALSELEQGEKPLVVIDRDTEELWIRTLVKNDGILRIPNLRKAMADAFKLVRSKLIREAFAEGLMEGLAQQFDQGSAEGFRQEFVERVGKALANPLSPFPFPLSPIPPAPDPADHVSSSTNGCRDNITDDATERKLTETWQAMAHRRMGRRKGADPITDRAAYERKTVRALAAEYRDKALAAVDLKPEITPAELAELLDFASVEGRPACDRCETTGWVPDDTDGFMAPCPDCNATKASA